MSADAAPAGAAGARILSIESLCVTLESARILDQVSINVSSGEILGLVGASGSGKSMTALSIMQLLPAAARTSGAVRLRGQMLSGMKEPELRAIRGRHIGMVFQEPMTALNPLMRIGDQVAETVRLHLPASAGQAAEAAREALDRVGLTGAAGALDRYPYELSGGQRQRVAIAMATVLWPSLLIADEPTTALDAGAQVQILRLLQEFAHGRGQAVILVSHDLAVISQVTDRIAVMEGGKIVEQLATRDLMRRTHHPYTEALLAAARLAPKRAAQGGTDSTPVLEVRDLVREYPARRRSLWRRAPPLRAVDRVSLTVHAGETVALVGESGSGKSSLLRTILALDRPQSGEIRLLGERFSMASRESLSRLRRSIQVVLQDPYGSFDPLWPVERLVAEPYHALDAPPGAAERRINVATVLEQVGLSTGDARRYPHEFSGGQRQRIAIARALILKPAVIAFDEAVSALDVLVRAQILELLAELAQRLRLAYLFVSHDLNVVESISDRVYVMRRGRIVEEGPTQAVFGSPQHAYTKKLLAATPRIGRPL
ncbi:MAG: ABC transporter ATP-binding protein [Steroidobacteraceae bacterium]|jgi:peptide/nickel transport system ATP-binding protein